ncbi:hypothetical protein CPB83DRAFT_501517 [Crepidotus variabilis]|uniref:Uncharacterized protein n=1 Tax=Crepidotus variabilis TaxID=179855 RepID=A0A9P6EBT1_9AGAR|nr:hypothetical protein CPB83DRAFT_501517 [Crepidotus variabilis]
MTVYPLPRLMVFVGYDFLRWFVRMSREVEGRVLAAKWRNELSDKGLLKHCRVTFAFNVFPTEMILTIRFLRSHNILLVGEYLLNTTPATSTHKVRSAALSTTPTSEVRHYESANPKNESLL